MADYISREDLINHLAICKKGTDIPNLAWATITAIECYIRDMPAADVVEVEQCRKCEREARSLMEKVERLERHFGTASTR